MRLGQLIDQQQAQIRFLGDTGLLVTFGAAQDQSNSPDARSLCNKLANKIKALLGKAYRDHCFGLRSVALYFDPMLMDESDQDLIARLRALQLEGSDNAQDSQQAPKKHLIPLCYEEGLDFQALQQEFNLSKSALIDLHSACLFDVALLGFLPGLAYMYGLNPALSCSRLSEPRLKVPKGAVGIAGSMSVIYPQQSPGGWRIIGRTPYSFFQAEPQPRARLKAGDKVQFYPISTAEFDQISAKGSEALCWRD